jgi:hypothetical protein
VQTRILRTIGSLHQSQLEELDRCLNVSLHLK